MFFVFLSSWENEEDISSPELIKEFEAKQKKNCKSFLLRRELSHIKKPTANFRSIFRSKKFLDAGLEHNDDEDDLKGIQLDQL